ncbi:GTPase Der [endosymbiont of Sipalinus gigas]|nr:GTPase Der [endosymbiont of Sipalinus gigas]
MIGKPKVGKTCLFKILTNKDINLGDKSTDLNYCEFIENNKIILIDTGGISFNKNNEIDKLILNKTIFSIKNSNLILFVLDYKTGFLKDDSKILSLIKKNNNNIICIVNKFDNLNYQMYCDKDFYLLKNKYNIIFISSINKIGINFLLKILINYFNENKKIINNDLYNFFINKEKVYNKLINISILGRSNSGKSTLSNSILKNDILITSKIPNTTTNNTELYSKLYNIKITDTIGIDIKKDKNLFFKKIKKVILKSNIILLLFDINSEISNKDINLINSLVKFNIPIIIGINKFDLVKKYEKKNTKKYLLNKFNNIKNYIYIVFISSLYKENISNLIKLSKKTFNIYNTEYKTKYINKLIKSIIEHYKINNSYILKIKYANIIKYKPLTIIIYSKNAKSIKNNDKKFIFNFFMKSLNIKGFFIKLIFKEY